jgi:hypothetical protein
MTDKCNDYQHVTSNASQKFASDWQGAYWSNAADWQGADGSDALPVHYAAQGMWYLAVTGQDVCEFAVLIGGQRFVTRRVERDEETIRGMVEQAREFWLRHVMQRMPPEPRTGADDLEHDDNLPEGGAVALLFVAVAVVIAALLGVYLLAAFIAS